MDPRRRERWIEDHGYVDTLITNPRLVQSGLDLVSFQTVVFYEPEYSLYTLWQALRRVWRLGQTQPVKAVFAVYKDAMEAQALALMGCKMRAALTLYGDEVGGAIVPVEEGDFITELAREVLRGAELDDLQSLFADEMRVSNSPMGCPTEISPLLLPVKTWLEWALEHQVDFITTPGYLSGPGVREAAGLPRGTGPLAVVSTLALMDYDPDTCRMRLRSLHPGVTVEAVKENTGFELIIPAQVGGNEAPSSEELRILRQEIDPTGFYI